MAQDVSHIFLLQQRYAWAIHRTLGLSDLYFKTFHENGTKNIAEYLKVFSLEYQSGKPYHHICIEEGFLAGPFLQEDQYVEIANLIDEMIQLPRRNE